MPPFHIRLVASPDICSHPKQDMPITDHQAKYLAYELTKRRPSDSVKKSSGTPAVSMFTVESMARAGDHLILAACTDDETMLDEEQVRRLLTLPASTTDTLLDLPAPTKLDAFTATRQKEIQREALIEKIEGKLSQETVFTKLFAVRWVLN
jgi:hypothetical protein